ncbi:MAG: hypothetical protein KGJ09_03765 [Candidatus Omnitrophica bacterium]|nr:hypothetical protein [Candidatus Omnitrophota bacterium]MDE2009177.1 hypothetical protein [Candidatus Omnitrophota bacterium]MDE2213698.1 hypothetical protein [Candidatus Omnitrophota bacterium]
MSTAGCFLSLFFFGLLAFCNALRHPFVHDDVIFILRNPHIADLGHWYGAFQAPKVAAGLNTYYRPLLEVLYRLEYRLFGPHAFGFHLLNVIVHTVNGLLLFGLLEKLGFKRGAAWVVACIFLVHPVQTEAVSCISGISNLWMAMGVLLALHAYLNKWYAAALLCFVTACLGKEQALLFVPLVVVIDCWRGRKDFRAWGLFALAAGALLIGRRIVTGASLLGAIMASPGELCLRLAAIPRDIGMYVRLIFFPYGLHYYRSTDILQPDGLAWTVLFMALLAILYVCKRWPAARGTLFLGLGWFLAALLPVLNIVPLVNEYSFILTPEHFLYLPIVGILIIAVAAGDHFLKSSARPLAGLVIITCLLLTWHQNTFWRSETALFERTLQFEPNFGRGHWLLAKAYYADGRPQLAQGHFKRAYAIFSAYARKAKSKPAKDFYLRYLKHISSDWSQNERVLGRGAISNTFAFH